MARTGRNVPRMHKRKPSEKSLKKVVRKRKQERIKYGLGNVMYEEKI